MKKENFADALLFPGYVSHLGQSYLDVSTAFVFNIDDSVVPEYDAWQWLLPQFKQVPFDIGLRHGRGCFAVAGSAYSPLGEVNHLAVSAQVGEISKSLWVHGDRVWEKAKDTWLCSEAKPFTSMPLELTHAMGHKEWQENPHGIGYYPNAEEALGKPVANIENADEPILRPDDPLAVGTFLPLPAEGVSQSQWLGTFDEDWEKERFPWLPDDTDLRWYDRVSQDQCLPQEMFWQGDESWKVTNMHPEETELSGQLPAIRPRIFYRMKKTPDIIGELPTTLDTVWLFPNDKRVVLIYRGRLKTEFEDAHDVEEIAIFSEKMGMPKLPQLHYQTKWMEKIKSNVNGLLRAVDASGIIVPKVAVAGATLTSLAVATGASAKSNDDIADILAKQDNLSEEAKAAIKKAEKAMAEVRAVNPDWEKEINKKDPKITALKKAFIQGSEAFSQAIEQHVRNELQNAIDNVNKKIKEYGLEELLKDQKIPTADEAMEIGKNTPPLQLKPEEIQSYVEEQLANAEKKVAEQLAKNGLENIDEIRAEVPVKELMSDEQLMDLLSSLPIDEKDKATVIPAKKALEAKIKAIKAMLS